jgi:O-6-methylguanine DNA methyltransferase
MSAEKTTAHRHERPTSEDPRWAAVVARNHRADGTFYYSVETTGCAALRWIPVGSTASYAAIASRIGAPKGARAVAQACGANALAVAIPCHRVVRTDGSLSGYKWGVQRKQNLLARKAQYEHSNADSRRVRGEHRSPGR